MSRIRIVASKSATIAASANLSDAIPFGPYAGGIVHMPASWTSASIGFKVCSTASGTFLPLYDDNGSLVQIDSPSASQAYSLPPEIFAANFVKLWSQDGSGSNTAQAADRSITVDLKA